MNAYQAQRIRFGILAARHGSSERHKMTPDQIDYLEGCEDVGWRRGDAGTRKAFDREWMRLRMLEVRRAIIKAEARRMEQAERRALTDAWIAKAHPDSIVGQLWPHA